MNLASLASAGLAKVARLLSAEGSLQAEVAGIDASLAAFESGGQPLVKRSRMSPAARAQDRRGSEKALGQDRQGQDGREAGSQEEAGEGEEGAGVILRLPEGPRPAPAQVFHVVVRPGRSCERGRGPSGG